VPTQIKKILEKISNFIKLITTKIFLVIIYFLGIFLGFVIKKIFVKKNNIGWQKINNKNNISEKMY
jgi:hypothetical protein